MKKITSNKHTCWRCSTSDVSSTTHLVKDPVLDIAMRKYLVEGKLNSTDLGMLRQSRAGTLGLDLCSLVSNNVLIAQKQSVITVKQPVSLAVVQNEVLVVSQGQVLRFSKDGEARGSLTSLKQLVKPSDILSLRSGGLAVAHSDGVAIFSEEGKILKTFGKPGSRCYGLVEDDDGHLVTICANPGSKKAWLTEPGMTDVIFIDKLKDKVTKRIELVDVIQQEERKQTDCRFKHFSL